MFLISFPIIDYFSDMTTHLPRRMMGLRPFIALKVESILSGKCI